MEPRSSFSPGALEADDLVGELDLYAAGPPDRPSDPFPPDRDPDPDPPSPEPEPEPRERKGTGGAARVIPDSAAPPPTVKNPPAPDANPIDPRVFWRRPSVRP